MSSRLVLFLLLLAACNTAGPHFRGLEATRVTIEGSTFDIRVQRRLAEAIRINSEYAPRFGPIAERAQRAIEMVSGCDVTEMRGDQAQAIGLLDCGSGPPPDAVLIPGQSYVCFKLSGLRGPGLRHPDLQCDPV